MVKVGLREGKAFGSEENRVMRSEVRKKLGRYEKQSLHK
jgi:hypothetical protein